MLDKQMETDLFGEGRGGGLVSQSVNQSVS